MNRQRSKRHAIVFVGSLVMLAGCSQPQAGGPVSGKVFYNGKLLPSGAVTFHGPEGRVDVAEIEDGSYQIRRPPLGKCIITVMTVADTPAVSSETVEGIKLPPGAPRPRGKSVPIPVHYNDPKQSGLSITVTAEPQTHDIKLKSAK